MIICLLSIFICSALVPDHSTWPPNDMRRPTTAPTTATCGVTDVGQLHRFGCIGDALADDHALSTDDGTVQY